MKLELSKCDLCGENHKSVEVSDTHRCGDVLIGEVLKHGEKVALYAEVIINPHLKYTCMHEQHTEKQELCYTCRMKIGKAMRTGKCQWLKQ